MQIGGSKPEATSREAHGLEGPSTRSTDTQQQQQTMPYKNIEHLAFGFKHIVQIDHLQGLTNLKKLQLDNNCLTKIENLEHLVCIFVSIGNESSLPECCKRDIPLHSLFACTH